jgi:hypothetical protein
LNSASLMKQYKSEPPTTAALPLYPSQESLNETREAIEQHVDVIERLAIVLGEAATEEAAAHVPAIDAATCWHIVYWAVCLHLIADDVIRDCKSIISAVNDLAQHQADLGVVA